MTPGVLLLGPVGCVAGQDYILASKPAGVKEGRPQG